MSFGLAFRKKHLSAPEAKPARRKPAKPRKRAPARRQAEIDRAETRLARATMLGALVIAAAILAIFNSEGLRLVAGDVADSGVGGSLVVLAEAWDGAMERAGAKDVAAKVRGTVAGLRETRWADLAGPFRTGPVAAGTARAAEAPEIYTGALPRPAKHRLDDGAESARPHFDRSAAAGGH
jgi:hypothetical protein